MATYALPDIHGNLKGLNQAIDTIFKQFDFKKDRIVFLGDYIDRGVDSLGVVKRLYNLQKKYGSETIICLKGNHETMFLDWLHNPVNIEFIMNDYKLRTINSFSQGHFDLCDFYLEYSYGIIDRNTREDYTYKIAQHINAKHSDIINWLKNLPYYLDRIEEENTLYIHGGIEEEDLGLSWKEYTTEHQMVWKYPPSYGMNPYGFNIVSGHIMVDEFWKFSDKPIYKPYLSGNHYYIDGASPYNDVLNILKVENNRFYIMIDHNDLEEMV